MPDGARNALFGYLYQLLGTATVRVREAAVATDAWADLVARVGRGDVLCEEFQEDATVHPAASPRQGVTAIQFKHSGTVGSVIDRDELIDILCAFDRSRREAAAVGTAIDYYALVTNRQLDARAEQIVAHRTTPTPHPFLTLTTARKGTPVPGNVKRLEPYGGNPDDGAAAWHRIIRALDVLTGETFEVALHRLRRFASRYGVLEGEWEGRLNALVGALVGETSRGGRVEVSHNWLKGHLVGDREAANLRFGCSFLPHVSTICRRKLDERAEQQHRVRPELYLERRIQQELGAELEQHPVVFVAGGGGCGKSLAVVNYLRSVANRQLVWSEGAASASEEELVGAFTDVRMPGRQHGGVDRCLRDVRARLDVANGGRPVWTIDLDGIDEAPDRYSKIRELINLCWARGNRAASPASIVVTCRPSTGDRFEEELIGQWFDTPEPGLVSGVSVLTVGNFVEEELVDAARRLNGAPEQRIIETLSVGRSGVTGRAPPVPEGILRTLCHPVVWGGYACLTETDRNGVLDGKPIPLARLAEQLLGRFLRRCQVRKAWRDVRGLEGALPAVARALTGAPPYGRESWDWACDLCLDRAEARTLYSESLSYGIINRDGRGWRWAHPFLTDYLITLNGGDASE